MKFEILSDVHLEFGFLYYEPMKDTDVVIFAGDIGTGLLGVNWVRDTAKFYPDKHFVMVSGNHECYGHKLEDVKNYSKHSVDNFHFLYNEFVDIGDYRILGGTCWTDLTVCTTRELHSIVSGMNDFRHIDWGVKEWFNKVEVWNNEHEQFREFLDNDISPEKKNIVVSHHLPTKKAVSSYYSDSTMNNAYASNILHDYKDKGIVAWIHGHSHSSFDETIDDIRVLRNPRGYIGYEYGAENFKPLQVEL